MRILSLFFPILLLTVLSAVSIACWELANSRIEQRVAQRFVPRSEVEALVIQANQVINAHDAAIKQLQERTFPKPKEDVR